MKKVMLGTVVVMASSFLLVSQGFAEETYPVKATSNANLILKADDEDGDGGTVIDPGGDGEIVIPDPGEDGDGGVVNPGQKTPLRLSLLTAFDFGEIVMSGNTKTYNANLPEVKFVDENKQPEKRPNFIQVTDNRGTNAGWRLTAQIAEQFTNGASVLTGSIITLNNGWATPQEAALVSATPNIAKPVTLSHDSSQLIANAPVEKGMGTWNILYGTLNETDFKTKGNASESVVLEVPGSVKKVEGKYQAKIEWTLSDVPDK